jgi:hypothetical protein
LYLLGLWTQEESVQEVTKNKPLFSACLPGMKEQTPEFALIASSNSGNNKKTSLHEPVFLLH